MACIIFDIYKAFNTLLHHLTQDQDWSVKPAGLAAGLTFIPVVLYGSTHTPQQEWLQEFPKALFSALYYLSFSWTPCPISIFHLPLFTDDISYYYREIITSNDWIDTQADVLMLGWRSMSEAKCQQTMFASRKRNYLLLRSSLVIHLLCEFLQAPRIHQQHHKYLIQHPSSSMACKQNTGMQLTTTKNHSFIMECCCKILLCIAFKRQLKLFIR